MHALACVLAGFCLGQTEPESFEFRPGAMQSWEGEGFYLTSGTARGPKRTWGVCSSDAGTKGGKAQLARNFKVPDNATYLRGRAFHNLAKGNGADFRLDVVLIDASRRAVPKQVYAANGWTSATRLSPRWKGMPRDYSWDLSAYRGQTLRLVIRDLDDRPGSHVYAGGFHMLTAEVPAAVATATVPATMEEFPRFMLDLENKHSLAPMTRYDSKRFTAVSNAREKYAKQHLRYCEVFYDLFVDHFRRRGFAVQPPAQKLMVCIFDTPKGFEAYLGRRMPPGITGVYHTPSNRLVLYDLAQNSYLLANRDQALKVAELSNPHDRVRVSDTVERRYKDAANDANLSTTMHEAAHLISFNSGLLRRDSDMPVWLAEGLATYCEATDEGDWQSLGSPNPLRIDDLRRVRGEYMSLNDLVRDDWLRSNRVLLGYAQSWALFRLMMQERPGQLRSYLGIVATRRVPEYRLADLQSAVGDVGGFEQRYRAYLDSLIAQHKERRPR